MRKMARGKQLLPPGVSRKEFEEAYEDEVKRLAVLYPARLVTYIDWEAREGVWKYYAPDIAWTEKGPDITATLPATSRVHRLVNKARAAHTRTTANQNGGNSNQATRSKGNGRKVPQHAVKPAVGTSRAHAPAEQPLCPIIPLPWQIGAAAWVVCRAYGIEDARWGRVESTGEKYILAYVMGSGIHERFLQDKAGHAKLCERRRVEGSMTLFPRRIRRGYVWIAEGEWDYHKFIESWLELAELVFNPDAEEVEHYFDDPRPKEDGTWNVDDPEAEGAARAIHAQWNFGGEWGWSPEEDAHAVLRLDVPPRGPIYQTYHVMEGELQRKFMRNARLFELFCARNGYHNALQFEGDAVDIAGRPTGLYVWEITADQRLHNAITAQIMHMSLPKYPLYKGRKLIYHWQRGDGSGSKATNS